MGGDLKQLYGRSSQKPLLLLLRQSSRRRKLFLVSSRVATKLTSSPRISRRTRELILGKSPIRVLGTTAIGGGNFFWGPSLMIHQLHPTFYHHQILKSIYPLFNIEKKIGPKAGQMYITSWNCGFVWQKVVFFFWY